METWVPVHGFEDEYQVSDAGRVRRVLPACGARPFHILSPRRRGDREYPAVILRKDGKSHSRLVHRLVLSSFSRPPLKGEVCAHWNGDSRDNRLANLRWTSHKGNSADSIRLGRTTRGERMWRSKLTESEVRDIRSRLKDAPRGTAASLAREYDVTPATICLIRKNRNWSWC